MEEEAEDTAATLLTSGPASEAWKELLALTFSLNVVGNILQLTWLTGCTVFPASCKVVHVVRVLPAKVMQVKAPRPFDSEEQALVETGQDTVHELATGQDDIILPLHIAPALKDGGKPRASVGEFWQAFGITTFCGHSTMGHFIDLKSVFWPLADVEPKTVCCVIPLGHSTSMHIVPICCKCNGKAREAFEETPGTFGTGHPLAEMLCPNLAWGQSSTIGAGVLVGLAKGVSAQLLCEC